MGSRGKLRLPCALLGEKRMTANQKRMALARELKAIENAPDSSDSDIHNWLCHPGQECKDGCDQYPDADRLEVYLEAG